MKERKKGTMKNVEKTSTIKKKCQKQELQIKESLQMEIQKCN